MAKGKDQQQVDVAEEPHGFEFGGPIGAAGIILGLPVACYAMLFLCNDISGCPAPSLLHPSSFTLEKLKQEVGWPGFAGLLNAEAFTATLGWYLFSLLLNVVLPAEEPEGVELRTGGRLKYRMNAFNSSMLTLALAAGGTLLYGAEFPLWTFIWKNYIQLLTSNIIIASALSVFVYVRSFSVKPGNKDKRELAAGGHSGNMIYDFYIGRELNPRITLPFAGEVDIKSWMELRPGMLGWIILNLAFMAHQYQLYGKVTDSMLIVVLAQSLYVLDAMYMEPAILTTIDITTDGFGFMLSFGDLVWLPFTYSIQARYLAIHPVELGFTGVLGVLSVTAFGYYIFRSTNNEKNVFRTNPNDPKVAHLQYIQTKTGSKLITSGWWGKARHINYLGDWIMSWSYCLPTGLAGYVIQKQTTLGGTKYEVTPGEARGWATLFTYFFMLYFAVLLIHRQNRDEIKCRRKYGKDWDEYCKKVPYKIVPGVY